jgi:nucleoside-diphosphate-sugar epimerase
MEFIYDNVVGTGNILEFARKINEKKILERFIYFSTDEVFGPAPPGIFYKENDRYNSTNPFEFMDMISLQGKTNFFEKRVSEYQKAGVLNNDTRSEEISFDEDF